MVEDDLAILTGLSMSLRSRATRCSRRKTAGPGLQKAIDEAPDLLVLDVMLPQMNGFEVLEELRARGSHDCRWWCCRPEGLEPDKIIGLNLGADDYVVKPFGLQELLARIRAVLRRRFRDDEPVRFSDTAVDLESKTVSRAGQVIDLTAQEFKLLAHFVTHPGRTFSRDELLSGAWGYGYEGTARTVDNFVSQLRSEVRARPRRALHFKTVRGLGYRFDP